LARQIIPPAINVQAIHALNLASRAIIMPDYLAAPAT
jgi:hypothetical protein